MRFKATDESDSQIIDVKPQYLAKQRPLRIASDSTNTLVVKPHLPEKPLIRLVRCVS